MSPSEKPLPLVTTPEAWYAEVKYYSQLPPERRLQIASEMTESLRARVTAGVRYQHPEYTDNQVRLAVIRLYLGDDLFRQVYPGAELL